ncbi:MAG: hypothetical protein FWD11_09320 [Micrococcales bacterium]|nr:hypothetical protein [Micrococcales bacterium]
MDDEDRLVERLRGCVGSDAFVEMAYEVVEEFDRFDDPRVFVGPVIQLIEDNPDADFGCPGPLVHFVERFYKNGYENLLVDSLERRPVPHTVWMLRRIINAAGPDQREYLDLLHRTAQRQDIDEAVGRAIQLFLDPSHPDRTDK